MNDKGYTIVELIVTFAIVSMIFVLLLSTLQFSTEISGRIKGSGRDAEDIRSLHLFFQKQVLKSEKVYLKNGRLYLQDMESANRGFYNYYHLDESANILYRYKVKESDLQGIGLGAKGQIADQIEFFNMQLNGKNIQIKIMIKGQIEEINMILSYSNEVIYVE